MSRLIVFATLAIAVLTAQQSLANELKLEIFVSESDEINVTSPLIMGPTEMMVMAAQGTKSAAIRLADLIESKGLRLTYVFLSHPHLDHSQGASILKQRFPNTKFIAPPEVASLQRLRMEADDSLAESRHGDNAAIPSIPFEDYESEVIEIDGVPIEIWNDLIGDAGIGYPDEPHAALYIPSLKALFPSDIIYFDAHVMLGGSTVESRAKWVSQIDSWLKMDLDVVLPGHMPRTSLPKLTPEGALNHSRDYILAYDKVLAESETSDEVIEKMLSLYPDAQHQSALYLGTFINFKETHRLLFNPTIETIASYLPGFFVRWVDGMIFDSRQEAANHAH